MENEPVVRSSLEKFKPVERVLSLVQQNASPPRSPERKGFDFLSLRAGVDAPPALDLSLARGSQNDRPFSHDEAAAQDAATIAINAERILRDAHDRLEAERAEAMRARKKERKVRYVMSDSDPLIKACKKGDDERVRDLLAAQDPEELKEYVNSRDKNGSTPIFHTVWPGHLESLRILLENGADPNIQNNRLNTALHLACEQKHQDLILTLIQFGASITLLNLNNTTCFNTLADPVQRSKMENFVKRCWNDVRRGHMGEQKYRLPKAPKRAEFWKKRFYEREYFSEVMPTEVAKQVALVPNHSEFSRALSPISLKAQVNEGGVPDTSDFFYDFLDVSLKDRSTKARMEEFKRQQRKLDASRLETEEEERREEDASPTGSRKKKRQQTAFIRPTSSGANAQKKRRRSTGDIAASGSGHPAAVRDTVRSLEILTGPLGPEQSQFVAFLLLMHPTSLPPPPPLPAMPEWLIEYQSQKRLEEKERRLEERRIREEQRPKLSTGHEYALTRMRTAAFAGAQSELFTATMLADGPTGGGSKSEIPHAHQPDLIRPTVKLLKDLTVHLPITPVKVAPERFLKVNKGARAASAGPLSPSKQFVPHTHTRSSGLGGAKAESWDATALAMDKEQQANILKNPSYSNWVLRQLSALKEVEESSLSSSLQPTAREIQKQDDAHLFQWNLDKAHMTVTQDAELRGLVDREVESFLQRKYAQQIGPSSTSVNDGRNAAINDPLAEFEFSSSPPIAPTPANAPPPGFLLNELPPSSLTVPSMKLPASANKIERPPSPPSARLGQLAQEYLVDERESYLRGLYVQISSTLTRLKKSGALYIAPELARRIKRLNPSLLVALSSHASPTLNKELHSSPSAGRLDSGGLRTEYSTLQYDSSALKASFEQQVRELIQQRKQEREEMIRQGMSTADGTRTTITSPVPHSTTVQSPSSPAIQPKKLVRSGSAAPPSSKQSSGLVSPQSNHAASVKSLRSGSSSGFLSPSRSSTSSLFASPQFSAVQTTLPQAASDAALSSAALQRALIAQYNPRQIHPFVGGGAVERLNSPSGGSNGHGFSVAGSPDRIRLNLSSPSGSPSKSSKHAHTHHQSASADEDLPFDPMHYENAFTNSYGESDPLYASSTFNLQDHEPQVLEIHHSSNYSTYRNMLSSSHGRRPGTSGGARPMTTDSPSSRPRTSDLSISKQALVLPADLPTNPLVAVGVTSPSRPGTMSKSGSKADLFSSAPTHSQLYAELNPTRRPNPLGHCNAVQRPSTASTFSSPASPQTGSLSRSSSKQQLLSPAAKLRSPSAGMLRNSSTQSLNKSASSSSFSVGYSPEFSGGTAINASPSGRKQASVQPIFTAPSAVAVVHPSSVSARIGNILTPDSLAGPEDEQSRKDTSSAITTGLLRKIKSRESASAKAFRPVGKVIEGKPGVITSASPTTPHKSARSAEAAPSGSPLSTHVNSFSVGVDSPTGTFDEEKDQVGSFPVRTLNLSNSGASFQRDTSQIARALGDGLEGNQMAMQPKLGYAITKTKKEMTQHRTSDVPQVGAWSADQSPTIQPLGFPSPLPVTNVQRPTSAAMSPSSRANVNKEKAIAKRLAHAITLKETNSPLVAAVGVESAIGAPVGANSLVLDPDWLPHPAMDHNGIAAPYVSSSPPPSTAASRGRAKSAALRGETMTRPRSRSKSPFDATGTISQWDATDLDQELHSPPPRVMQQGEKFQSVQRQTAQLGLIVSKKPAV